MTYIVINTVFLFEFCQQNLSIVRNWICNFWNEIQHDIYQFISINFNDFFENIFYNEKKIMSYELSHHFVCYQTKVRFFRVFLFEFEYFFDDQTYFDDKFNDFINQINQTILTMQKFHFHIVKIIIIYLFNIKFVIKKLDDDDIVSQIIVFVSIDNFLTQNMTHLNFWHLIYFSIDIESFQISLFKIRNIKFMKFMKNHVILIKKRLKMNVDLILTLQKKFWSFEKLFNEIIIHVFQFKS